MLDEFELEERIDVLPSWAVSEAEQLLADIRPFSVPAWSDKQEYVLRRALNEVIEVLGVYAQDDFRYVTAAIKSAPFMPIDLRFAVALQAAAIVKRKGVRGIGEYVRYVKPITERSIFAAAGFVALTPKELAASPISLDELCYATARGAMHSTDPFIRVNADGTGRFTNDEPLSNLSRSILGAFQTYPEQLRKEAAAAALPFYNKIAPRIPAIEFLERFGTMYATSAELGRPFGVASARLRYRGDSFQQVLSIAADTALHVEHSGLSSTTDFWEQLARFRRPCWQAAKVCAERGAVALREGTWPETRPLFVEVTRRRDSLEALALVSTYFGSATVEN